MVADIQDKTVFWMRPEKQWFSLDLGGLVAYYV